MEPKIIILTKAFGADDTRLSGALQKARLKGCDIKYETLNNIKEPNDADALIVGTDSINAVALSLFPRLKAVVKFGVGTDNINITECSERGIYVAKLNAGINSDAVAEFTLALMLTAARKIVSFDRCMKQENWKKSVGTSLVGKTVGVVGTGAIGVKLAHLLKGFDVKIIGYDLFPNERFKEEGGEYIQLDNLLRNADFITIHLPLNEKTKGIIGRAEIAMMKKSAYVINTARGGIVDEQALIEALDDKIISGAALDVFNNEPPLDWRLAKHVMAVATPHVAAYTVEALEKMEEAAIDTAMSLVKGVPTDTTLNADYLSSSATK